MVLALWDVVSLGFFVCFDEVGCGEVCGLGLIARALGNKVLCYTSLVGWGCSFCSVVDVVVEHAAGVCFLLCWSFYIGGFGGALCCL